MNSNPFDKTEKVVELRDVTDDDLPILFEHQREPEANRMAAYPGRDRDAFMAHWAKILADKSNVVKAVLVDGRVAGNAVCFHRWGKRQVGYWIGEAFWGRGIATRALALLLDEVPARPLYAFVAVHNAGSIRVVEKILGDTHDTLSQTDYQSHYRLDATRAYFPAVGPRSHHGDR